MVEQKTPKKQDNLVIQTSCLYISTNNTSLSESATEELSKIGLSIRWCLDIKTAKELCDEHTFGMIFLEECEDKTFFANIKKSGSRNEQTPVILIFSDTLSETAKGLVKDQYVDDVIFKCTTFDSDLTKAVKRLLDEPLHFAVTPKTKRADSRKTEGNTPKRQRLDKTPISARKSILGLPVGGTMGQKGMEWPMPVDSTTIHPFMLDPSLGYTNMDTSIVSPNSMYGTSAYPMVPVINNDYEQAWIPPHNVSSQYHYFPDYIPDYHAQPGVGNSMGILTAAMEMSLAAAKIQNCTQNVRNNTLSIDASKQITPQQEQESNAAEFQQGPYKGPLNYVQPSDEQAPLSTGSEVPAPLQSAVPVKPMANYQELLAEEIVPKITLSGARRLLDSALQVVDVRSSTRDVQIGDQRNHVHDRTTTSNGLTVIPHTEGEREEKEESNVTPKRRPKRKRSLTFKEGKTSESPSWTPASAAERKEIHLGKERKRRERIARCWYFLRNMIPSCNENTDKATVFEMTVAYLHHCWKYHADIIQKINKDFKLLCSVNEPPENMDTMETMVNSLLEKEQQALCDTPTRLH